jgi:hypothetical protein
MHIDRSRAAEVGRDTVRILDEGGYRSPSGAWVDLRALLERAVRETQEYPPNCRVENNIDRGNPPTIAVENGTPSIGARMTRCRRTTSSTLRRCRSFERMKATCSNSRGLRRCSPVRP